MRRTKEYSHLPSVNATIIDIAKPLGIAVHGHIIVGKNGHARLRGRRLI